MSEQSGGSLVVPPMPFDLSAYFVADYSARYGVCTTKLAECYECGGSGRDFCDHGEDHGACPVCDGKGTYQAAVPHDVGVPISWNGQPPTPPRCRRCRKSFPTEETP